jgi:branched-chain amino acid transport system permease protein
VDYFFHIIVMVSIYSILALSLDMLAGHTGLLSLTHAGFFGVGAYAAALLSMIHHTPLILNMAVAGTVSAVVSLLISVPSLRLRDDYFVIATFGFQMLLFSVLNNWISLTRGPQGLAGIPGFHVLGFIAGSRPASAAIGAMAALFFALLLRRLLAAPFGRVLHAIREDEIFAQSLGKDTVRFKVRAFAISAAIAGCAGCVYAQYVTYIDPSSFTVSDSILLISMVVIGGIGTSAGPVVGAGILVVFPEALRFMGVSSSVAANVREILYGALLIAVIFWRPSGIVGRRKLQWL